MAGTNLTGVTWLDGNGRTALTLPRTSTPTSIGIQTALQAKSNASIASYFTGPEVLQVPSPVIADYQSVLDRAILYFQTASGVMVQLQLPAPQIGIFMADQYTVDPSQITAIIAAAISALTDPSGNAVVGYVNGVRQQRKGI